MIRKDTKKETLEKLSKDCKKCGHCCTYGSGWVLDEEIPGLAKHIGMDAEEFKKTKLDEFTSFNTTLHRFKQKSNDKPYGNCVFRGPDMRCTIQEIKPLHCRITSCKEHGVDANEWFIVNHFVRTDDPESVREWSIRIKIHPTIPGGDIESLIPEERYRKLILKRK